MPPKTAPALLAIMMAAVPLRAGQPVEPAVAQVWAAALKSRIQSPAGGHEHWEQALASLRQLDPGDPAVLASLTPVAQALEEAARGFLARQLSPQALAARPQEAARLLVLSEPALRPLLAHDQATALGAMARGFRERQRQGLDRAMREIIAAAPWAKGPLADADSRVNETSAPSGRERRSQVYELLKEANEASGIWGTDAAAVVARKCAALAPTQEEARWLYERTSCWTLQVLLLHKYPALAGDGDPRPAAVALAKGQAERILQTIAWSEADIQDLAHAARIVGQLGSELDAEVLRRLAQAPHEGIRHLAVQQRAALERRHGILAKEPPPIGRTPLGARFRALIADHYGAEDRGFFTRVHEFVSEQLPFLSAQDLTALVDLCLEEARPHIALFLLVGPSWGGPPARPSAGAAGLLAPFARGRVDKYLRAVDESPELVDDDYLGPREILALGRLGRPADEQKLLALLAHERRFTGYLLRPVVEEALLALFKGKPPA